MFIRRKYELDEVLLFEIELNATLLFQYLARTIECTREMEYVRCQCRWEVDVDEGFESVSSTHNLTVIPMCTAYL